MLRLLAILLFGVSICFADSLPYKEPSKELLDNIQDGINKVFEQADANNIQVDYKEPSNKLLDEIREDIDQFIEESESTISSDDFNNELDIERKRISEVDIESGNTFYKLDKIPTPELKAKEAFSTTRRHQEHKEDEFNFEESLIVLVSFSMPERLIIDYLQEAQKIGARVVLKGPVNDSLDETIKRISGMIKEKDYKGMMIDPTLFSRFDVKSAPTLVLPLESIKPCDPNGCETPEYVKASGSISIEYFLEKVGRVGGDKASKIAERWLDVLQG